MKLSLRALAAGSVRHRRLVVALWLAALVVVTLAARSAGSDYSNEFSVPGTQSAQAVNLLDAASPKVAGDTERVVFDVSGDRSVTDPAIENRVTETLARLSKVPHVTTVVSPYSPAGAGQISASKTVAFATVTFDQQAQAISDGLAKRFVNVARSGDETGLQVAVSGQVAENANGNSLGSAGFGVLLAAVVLFLVFGSLFAMLLPLISALASLGTAIGIIELLSHAFAISDVSTTLTLLIGLGVGIDYALFIVTRHRQGLLAGHDVTSSIVTAVDTSGRAVLFAGTTVCIALLGMLALGIDFLDGLAIGAAIGVAATVLAALTLLPALLGFLGPRVLSRRQRRRLVADGPTDAASLGFWSRWAGFVQRRPGVPVLAALVVIGVLASSFFSIRLGSSDQGTDPPGTTTRIAYDMLAKGFGPGFNGPLQLVAEVPSSAEPELANRLVHDVGAQPGVARVAEPTVVPVKGRNDVLLVNVYPTTSPQDAGTTDLINHLRDSTIPRVTAGTGVKVYVGGQTAIFLDFDHVITEKLPLFLIVVVLLSFLLLAIVFRSVVIPLTGAVMNLLSIGAALGILVAVFQNGVLANVLGVSTGPIDAFLPVMVFAIVFGLSMDYQVFLVTRIHEEWLRTHDNALAVRNGLAVTGPTISAAALIMVLVFGSFIFGGARAIKEFGLGLAGGVLVDALVIRMAIVPALMRLLGRSNWWFPRWADRMLPHISVEPQGEASAVELPIPTSQQE